MIKLSATNIHSFLLYLIEKRFSYDSKKGLLPIEETCNGIH